MEIRATDKEFQKIQKVYRESSRINHDMVVLNNDASAETPVIMVQNQNKELVSWTTGFDNVMSFLKHGYVKISDGKYCPLIKGKCKGEKCAFYLVENNTGDCSIRWTGIMSVLSRLR